MRCILPDFAEPTQALAAGRVHAPHVCRAPVAYPLWIGNESEEEGGLGRNSLGRVSVNWNIAVVLGLLVLTIVLFALELFSVDVITLAVLLVLIATGILSPAAAFSGFSEEIIVMLASVFVIGGALQESGVLDAVTGRLTRWVSGSEPRVVLLLLVLTSGFSAFMNNTTVTAMFIGPVLALARQRRLAASKILLPMAYASIFGGTCTLIGTSTNLAVSGFIAQQQMQPLGLFEITPMGLIITVTGIAYLMLLGRRFLPEQVGPATESAERELANLGELNPSAPKRRKGLYVLLFFVVALVVGGLKLLPLSVCFLAAALLAIFCRALTVEQAYKFIDWRLLILIGGMTAFGLAIERTGAAELLAGGIDRLLSPLGVMGVLAGNFALTIFLTQPMSNAAAALVVLPVALQSARDLGVNQRTFAIAIMLAASISFIAPFEPSCILVYGPGKYRFMDFVKTGVLLTLILSILVLILIPFFWPLHPVAGHGLASTPAAYLRTLR